MTQTNQEISARRQQILRLMGPLEARCSRLQRLDAMFPVSSLDAACSDTCVSRQMRYTSTHGGTVE